jgi:ssDNA-binding Zn-finger/Zn-ribbon topoisomerase 1
MEKKIECPNCGKAYLKKKKLRLGKPGEYFGTEIVCKCPNCKVLFHEEQLGIKLN